MVLPHGRASGGRAAPVTSLGVALAVNPGRTLVGDGTGAAFTAPDWAGALVGMEKAAGWPGLGSRVRRSRAVVIPLVQRKDSKAEDATPEVPDLC